MSIKSSIQDWKERAEAVPTIWTAASLQLDRGPCLLVDFLLCGSSSAAGFAVLYDGVGTGGTKVFEFRVLTATTYAKEFHPPVKFHQGMFVELGGSVDGATVRYVPLKN